MIFKFRVWNGKMLSPHHIGSFPINNLRNDRWICVMPYINVNDIDGKEIYLNDIIELADGSRGVVKFKDGHFYHTAETDIMGLLYWYKVIGNIFENPELNNENSK